MGEAMPKDDPQHLPPSNIEAEEALLGAMLISEDAIRAAEEHRVRATDFYRESHRLIFQTITDLVAAGDSVDELLVVTELKNRRKLTAAGGTIAVMTLAERCPAVANARAYAGEVIEKSAKRLTVQTGQAISRLGYEDGSDADEVVTSAVALVDQLARSTKRTNADQSDSSHLAGWLVEHTLGKIPPAPRFNYSMFPRLQEATGGFGKTEVVSIGAYSSDGKSGFKNQIVLGLDKSTRIGVFSLEMEPEEEQLRFASAISGIEARKMWDPDKLTQDEKLLMIEAAESLEERDYTIHSGIQSINAIYAEQRRQKYDVVIIDHFHLLPGTEETRSMAQVANRIKHMAMDTKCAVILLFQLNRSEDRTFPAPNVNRVRGGNALLDASNQMMFLYRERPDGVYPGRLSQLIMAKNRGGASGFVIPMDFQKERVSFRELEVAGPSL